MRKVSPIVISCKWCGETIPQEKVKKKGTRNPPKYCCRSHANKARARKFYQKFSKAGNVTQAEIQAQTGHKPGHEKRSQAISKSNREKPRRKKKIISA